MNTLTELTEHLRKGNDLSSDQVLTAAKSLAGEGVSGSSKADFLVSLQEKGETPEEIAGFADAFLAMARDPGDGIRELASGAIDYVGTGGDRSSAFNISTTVSFILASAGVRVVKHGNRGATSSSGSADVLEAAGFALEAADALLEESLRELNFAFFFARSFHPAFRHIVPVRAELAAKGKRTVFNVLGPMINPARPGYQVMGVYSEELVEPLALALERLGVRRGLVVHGKAGENQAVDKFTTAGPTRVVGVGELRKVNEVCQPGDFGFATATLENLQGGTPAENFAVMQSILQGRGPVDLTNTVLLNAGAGLWVAGRAPDQAAGLAVARDLLKSGTPWDWLERARNFYAAHGQT